MRRVSKMRRSRRIRVGDRVYRKVGATTMRLEVVEDRGNLGIAGRQLIRVRNLSAYADPDRTFEVHADTVKLARRRNGTHRAGGNRRHKTASGRP